MEILRAESKAGSSARAGQRQERVSLLIRSGRLWRPLMRSCARLRRGKTLVVRAVVMDGEGRVVLVRHTYVAGWWLPGGGVDAGETAEQALQHELEEEAGVRLTARATLLSIHSNDARFRGDHVLLYRVDADGWSPCEATHPHEIAEIGWFDPHNLPSDLAAGTRARLREALEGAAPEPAW